MKKSLSINPSRFLFFQKIRKKCRLSLWLVPGIIGLFAIILALVFLFLEYRYENLFVTGWSRDLSKRTVTTTLSTLLAAIVMVFGILMPLIFSILLRASNQFTPKVLNIYRQALFPKLFLGLILGSTLYLMTVLATLNLFIWIMPSLSLLFAFLLIIITVYSIPLFFDRLTTSLEPTYLASEITQEIKKVFEGFETFQDSNQGELNGFQERSFLASKQYAYAVASKQSGYVETIEVEKLVEICERENFIAAIPSKTGDFILSGNPIVYIKGTAQPNNEVISQLQKQFSIGTRRLGITDVELQLEELLSIIVRSLSPGVTDLTTAIECINFVGSACNLLLNKRLSTGIHKDKKGEVRLYIKEFDFFGFVHAAFDPIRQNAYSQPAVILQVLHVIERLIDNSQSQERAFILKEIAFQFVKEAENKFLAYDEEKMKIHIQRIEALVNVKKTNNKSET